MAAQKRDARKIKYLVTDRKSAFVVEIPATWKVTFASVNPQAHASHDGYALRVYEGTKLRCVFDNVKSVRDLSVPFARRVDKETGASSWEKDSAGNFSESVTKQIETSFDTDDVEVEF